MVGVWNRALSGCAVLTHYGWRLPAPSARSLDNGEKTWIGALTPGGHVI